MGVYFIVQLNEIRKKIVGTVDDFYKLIDFLKKKYEGAKYLEISSDDLIYNYNNHDNGVYITINEKTDNMMVHEISTSQIQGYIYTYDQKSIKELSYYGLIQNGIDYPVKGNIVEYIEVNKSIPVKQTTNKNGTRNVVSQQLIPQEYDLNSMDKNFCVSITGKKLVGKTTLVCKLIDHKYKENPYKMLIVTKDDNEWHIYKSKFPNAQIEYDYDNLLVEKFINENKGEDKIIILEQMFHKNLNNNQYLTNIMKYRYDDNLSFVFTFQRPKPSFDDKFTTSFVFRDDNLILQNQYYKSYGKNYPSFTLFHKVFMDYTKNYQAMVFEDKKMNELTAYYISA